MNEICCLQKTPPKSSILEPNVDRGEDAILHIKEWGQQSFPLQYHLPLQALLTSSSRNSLVASRLGHTVLFPCFQTPSGFVMSRCLQQGLSQEGRRKTIHAWVQTPSRESWMVAKRMLKNIQLSPLLWLWSHFFLFYFLLQTQISTCSKTWCSDSWKKVTYNDNQIFLPV